MGFLSGVGSVLGNTFGINQSQGADKFRDIGTSALGSGAKYAGEQGQAFGNAAKESYGQNAGQTVQKAMQSAQGAANIAGRSAGGQATGAARTAGMNKGQAAMMGGQAATNAYENQIPQQIGNYMNAAGQMLQGGQGYTGQQIGAGGQAAGAAAQQGEQGQKGGGSMVSGLGSLVTGIFSDERLKRGIKKDISIDEVLAKIRPSKFNYKSESPGTPEHMGVMAQDLEKTPMKDAVMDTPQGKMIDTNKLTPSVLDLLLQLGEKVNKLEEKLNG